MPADVSERRPPGFLSRTGRLGRGDHVTGWALVSPAVVLIGIFGLLPVLMSLQLSFQKSDLLTPETPWVGFDNYKKLADDPVFVEAIKHTIVYTALFVPGTMLVGLFVAAALNRSVRFISVYRTAAYITMAVSTISQGIIFLWLTDRDYGLVNAALNAVGVAPQAFLASPSQALYVIVAMTIWGWTGFSVIVYLAALQGVPAELHEAAAIDGAQRVHPVPHHHRAAARTGESVPRGLADDQRIAAVRRGLRDHEGRTVARHHGHRLLPVGPRVREVRRRVRRGDGLCAVRRHPGDHRRAVPPRPQVRALMTESRRPHPSHLSPPRMPPEPAVAGFDCPSARGISSSFRVTFILIVPLLWMLITSLETEGEANRFPPVLLPESPRFENYSDAWAAAPFGHFFVNSALVTLVVLVSNLVVCSLAGYAFARIRFLGRGALFVTLMATLMVPFQVTMIPVFLIVKWFGDNVWEGLGIDHIGALMLPNLATAFGIFFLRQFFQTVPVELEEAARVDGTSRLGVLFKIVLPLSLPALSTLAALTVLTSWNDFLWPLIVITSQDQMTIPLGLSYFQGAHFVRWPLLMAANVMSLLPMLLVFIGAQRYFVQSVASTGLKG